MQALLYPHLLTKNVAMVAKHLGKSHRLKSPLAFSKSERDSAKGGPALTSHFSFRENKVLKKNKIQMTGQMISPSQKIRASTSVGGATVEGPLKGEKSKLF